MVARALGRRFVLPVKLPMWAVYLASVVAEKIGVLTQTIYSEPRQV